MSTTKKERHVYPYKKKVTNIDLGTTENKGQTKRKKLSKTQQYVLFGTLGAAGLAAALYGGVKIPYVKNVALPFIAAFASKNFEILREKLPMLQRVEMQGA